MEDVLMMAPPSPQRWSAHDQAEDTGADGGHEEGGAGSGLLT